MYDVNSGHMASVTRRVDTMPRGLFDTSNRFDPDRSYLSKRPSPFSAHEVSKAATLLSPPKAYHDFVYYNSEEKVHRFPTSPCKKAHGLDPYKVKNKNTWSHQHKALGWTKERWPGINDHIHSTP